MQDKIQRALISVSDKRGIESFARMLAERGVEILATGGTRKLLLEANIDVREVAEVTEFPEMMDGRVKTLHPRVHGGILALRENDEHVNAMSAHSIPRIDMVVVNLYPFEKTVAKEGVARADAIEQIDIGGPSMVRSAAKNHKHVAIVTDPDDYGPILDELEKEDGKLGEETLRKLAIKAYELTARYDAAISRWLFEQEEGSEETLPNGFSLAGKKALELRYGENPHQTAAFYHLPASGEPGVASAEVLGGKALSYNNLVDLDAALGLAKEFEDPFVCVIKHNNPCGAACGDTIAEALEGAWSGDPLSAFGSVLAFTRPVDVASAQFLVSENRFVEAIIAPSFDDDALELLQTGAKWGKNVRLLACGPFGPESQVERLQVKHLCGGFLVQSRDLEPGSATSATDLEVKTETGPSDDQVRSMLFADRVAKHVKSNAIVIAKGRRVLGVGAGQMSRVDSVKLAVEKSGDEIEGSVLASDAFFPFPDGVETAMEAGVTAILQPGGSMRDDTVVQACNARSVPMIFTGKRHFRH